MGRCNGDVVVVVVLGLAAVVDGELEVEEPPVEPPVVAG
jgi:hypothetical protein